MPETETETRRDGYLCIVWHYWGWGTTPAEAIARCRKATSHGISLAKGKRLIYKLPLGATNAYVDDIGQIAWTWADDAPDRTATGITIEKPKEH